MSMAPATGGVTGRSPLGMTVLLPAYNETANVEETVRRCLDVLRRFTDQPEVLVIDDGSTDDTGAIADRIAQEESAVRVVHNPVNLGVGSSLLVGMRAARGDLVLHNAMDYPFDMADLARVLPLFPANDVVIIVRTNRAAHSPWRKVTSLVHFWLIRVLFRVSFRDMNFVQVYKKEVLANLRVKARSPTFVTPELLIRARDRGYRFAEVEAVFHPRHRGQASYGKPRDILWALADMLSFWLEGRRP
jgi:glycosyltransferase involved in cell wall biosynthesis